jgi:3-deoxy-D-manno-octulosonate 8-phosphate phosphatase (KDO 8-P phosphatase)
MNPAPESIRHLAVQVKLLILDVDGVLTDGILAYSETGEEVKRFNAKDGLGIRLARENGIEIAVISARHSAPLVRRMKDLRIDHFYPGFDDKYPVFQDLLVKLELIPEQVAYVGDDILDLPIMRKVGLSIAVEDAHPLVKEQAQWVTHRPGGRGAVREVTDGLVACRRNLVEACDSLLAHHLGQGRLDKI